MAYTALTLAIEVEALAIATWGTITQEATTLIF
jgi:hypothetical protein